VAGILGIVDDEIFFGLSDAIKTKDAAKALTIVNSLTNDGKDVTQVVLGMIEHFRNISVAKVSSGKEPLIDAGADKIKRYRDEAGAFTIEEILYIIYTLSNTIDFIRKSGLSKIPFEAAMIKLARSGSIVSLDEILKRLDGQANGQVIDSRPIEKVLPPVDAPVKESISAPVKVNHVSSGNIEDILVSWKTVTERVKSRKMSVGSFLEEGYPTSVEKDTIVIGFPEQLKFHKEAIETPEGKRLIEECVSAVLNRNLRVAFELVKPANIKKVDAPYPEEAPEGTKRSEGTEKSPVDPIIKAAMEMFGGSIAAKGEAR